MPPVRKALYDWMSAVLDERGWTASFWARRAEVTPTNVTRFLRDPETASLPSAETIGRLARAADCEPTFLDGEAPPRPVRVPILDIAQLRALRMLGPRQAREYLEEIASRGSQSVLYDRGASQRAFALRLTSPHMNAAGLLPQDVLVLEPVDVQPPDRGDLVAIVDGDHVCAYRWHCPLLVPASTDPQCEPIPCDEASVIGVAIHMVRPLKREMQLS
jgi:SOS-response transcriptional repressor LexA